MLFLGNILLPAGASAMNLHCDTNAHAKAMHDCCDQSEMANHQDTSNSDDCLVLSFCEQVVDSQSSDVPAVLQHIKVVLSANVTDKLDATALTDDQSPESFRDRSVHQQYTAPIFLLNSVFLN